MNECNIFELLYRGVLDYIYDERYGKPEVCHTELFDCLHWELRPMRKLILDWMDTHLVKPTES